MTTDINRKSSKDKKTLENLFTKLEMAGGHQKIFLTQNNSPREMVSNGEKIGQIIWRSNKIWLGGSKYSNVRISFVNLR